jgi:hypothetical protein
MEAVESQLGSQPGLHKKIVSKEKKGERKNNIKARKKRCQM